MARRGLNCREISCAGYQMEIDRHDSKARNYSY